MGRPVFVQGGRIGTEVSDACPTPPPLIEADIKQAVAIAGEYHMEIVAEG